MKPINTRNLRFSLLLILLLSISACRPSAGSAVAEASPPMATPSQLEVKHDENATPEKTEQTTNSELMTQTPAGLNHPGWDRRNADDWKNWPILPDDVSPKMRQVYQEGLEKGNNSHAFSILGDCHSLPEVFMGVYDRDPDSILPLEVGLHETIRHFSGSFDRYSPTVADGTTEGALLWAQWNENKEGYCTSGELPIDCELRHHQPVIAFVHIGTHWEARNKQYLRTIIEKLLDNGTVPIIVFKADNRELDERVNENYARLAIEYELPVWNFWASVQDLPDQGLSGEYDMALSDAAYAIHREDGLRVLDFVHRKISD